MALAAQQKLLARLYVDGALRDRFAADPAAVAAEFGLGPADAERLGAAGGLHDFALSLVAKRAAEAADSLPLTRRALGNQYAALFRSYAEAAGPGAPKLPREDAVRFAVYLRSQRLQPAADLAAWEAAWLEADRRRLILRRLRWSPHALARAAETPGRPRPTLALWVRLGRSARLYCLPLPF